MFVIPVATMLVGKPLRLKVLERRLAAAEAIITSLKNYQAGD